MEEELIVPMEGGEQGGDKDVEVELEVEARQIPHAQSLQ